MEENNGHHIICFEHADIYNSGNLVISDLTMHIDKGEFVYIIGKVGSGKTTIVKLLLGFYEPNKGEVRVGDTADCDMFFNDYCSNESFVIRNNIFRYSRRYGMLIQATHGRIENNEFTGLSSSGIVLQNSASWPEGFVPYSVLVSGNLISGCGFDDTYLREGLSPIAIRTMTYLETTSAGYVPPVWKGVRNIEVSSNTVRTESASGIAVWDADEITFRDNRIECTGEPSIRTERCTNVVME